MIKVEVFLNSDGYMRKYRAKGHAKYDETGKDIICAAVSILSYTALNSLHEICGVDAPYSIDDNGFMEIDIPYDIDEDIRYKVSIVMETLVIGIKCINESYPEYVTLKYREV